MHHRERHLTSNTAHFSKLCLKSCDIVLRGMPEADENAQLAARLDSYPEHYPLYLFPDEESQDLTPELLAQLSQQGKQRFHLIVPDGSWPQARKMKRRIECLGKLKSVKLPLGKISEYLVRKQNVPAGLCTFEAIARALGTLESQQLQNSLDKILMHISQTILTSRNRSRAEAVEAQQKLWEELELQRQALTRKEN